MVTCSSTTKKMRYFVKLTRWWRADLMLCHYRNLNYEVIECIDKTNISHLSVKLWRCHTIRPSEASFNSDHTIDFAALIALCYFTDFPWQGDCQAHTAFIHRLLMITKLSLYFWEYFIDHTETRSIPLRQNWIRDLMSLKCKINDWNISITVTCKI